MLRRVSIPRRRTDAASCRGNASAQIFRQRVPEATGWSRFTKGLTYYCSLAIWPGAERRSHETCLYYTFRDDHGAGCSLAGGGAARDARNASEIAGFCIAVLQVRIHLSPAKSRANSSTDVEAARFSEIKRTPEQHALAAYGQPRFRCDHRPPLSTRELLGHERCAFRRRA